MPGSVVELGTGTSIAFGTTAFASQLLSVNWTGISRGVQETTPLAVAAAAAGTIGNRSYKAAHAVDPGTLEAEFHFNPNDDPPIGEDEETITITFPITTGDATAAIWSASGVWINFDIVGISLDEKMVVRATIKLTGTITFTDAT